MNLADFAVDHSLPKLIKGPVTKMQLVQYSGASGDFNPIHTIEEFAQSAGLGGVIAHGMLTMAFLGQMLTDAIGMNGTLAKFGVRFRQMVRPGDLVTCEGTITEIRDEGFQKVVVCDICALTGSNKVVVAGEAEFVLAE